MVNLKSGYRHLLSFLFSMVFSVSVVHGAQAQDFIVVSKGDTLFSIAKKNGTSVEQIRNLNGITDNNIKVGQRLVIRPSGVMKTALYTVKKGDTLWRISYNYGISLRQLMDINGMSQVSTLVPGKKLAVPVREDGGTGQMLTKPPSTSRVKLPRLAWPVRGKIPDRFDGKCVRIVCSDGAMVRPAMEGTVEYTGSLVGYRNVVIIRHPENLYTVYAALGSVNVEKGDNVKLTTSIGRVEKLRHYRSAFLYFEVVKDGLSADPVMALK